MRETVGFNKDRGDSVNVLNAPFAIEKQPVVDVPVWKQPEVLDLARSFAWPAGTLLLAGLILLGLVRPALQAMARAPAQPVPQPGSQLSAVVADAQDRPPLLPGPAAESSANPVATQGQLQLEDARKLTRENPAAVADIVKGWIGSEAPA